MSKYTLENLPTSFKFKGFADTRCTYQTETSKHGVEVRWKSDEGDLLSINYFATEVVKNLNDGHWIMQEGEKVEITTPPSFDTKPLLEAFRRMIESDSECKHLIISMKKDNELFQKELDKYNSFVQGE